VRRLLGPPGAVWRTFITLTLPRERALRARMEAEFRRTTAQAVSSVRAGHDVESGMGTGHDVRVRTLLRAAYAEGMPVYAAPVLSALGKAAKPKTACEQRVVQWIATTSAKKVTQISRTTRQQLRNVVARGRAEGLGTSAIASLIRDDFQLIGRARALSIARTETHSAANAAQLFAAEELGRTDMKREWIAAGDERTREDHEAADGQVVALDEPFNVGGEFLDYPGDADGSPEQVINCRCTTGFLVSD